MRLLVFVECAHLPANEFQVAGIGWRGKIIECCLYKLIHYFISVFEGGNLEHVLDQQRGEHGTPSTVSRARHPDRLSTK